MVVVVGPGPNWWGGRDQRCVRCPQVSANGSVLLSEVVGTIKLKVFLSGMPELRLGLNDRVLFELTGRECRRGGLGAIGGGPSPSPGVARVPHGAARPQGARTSRWSWRT